MADAAGSKYEKNSWPELARLAKDVPEAGIHFQSKKLYNFPTSIYFRMSRLGNFPHGVSYKMFIN
jgi:hypothetical protein